MPIPRKRGFLERLFTGATAATDVGVPILMKLQAHEDMLKQQQFENDMAEKRHSLLTEQFNLQKTDYLTRQAQGVYDRLIAPTKVGPYEDYGVAVANYGQDVTEWPLSAKLKWHSDLFNTSGSARMSGRGSIPGTIQEYNQVMDLIKQDQETPNVDMGWLDPETKQPYFNSRDVTERTIFRQRDIEDIHPNIYKEAQKQYDKMSPEMKLELGGGEQPIRFQDFVDDFFVPYYKQQGILLGSSTPFQQQLDYLRSIGSGVRPTPGWLGADTTKTQPDNYRLPNQGGMNFQIDLSGGGQNQPIDLWTPSDSSNAPLNEEEREELERLRALENAGK